MRKYFVDSETERVSNSNLEGFFTAPKKDFAVALERTTWSFEFHNTGTPGLLEGDAEIVRNGRVVGYADVVCSQDGQVTISNMLANPNYIFRPDIYKNMAGFIKRACFCVAKMNFAQAHKQRKASYVNRNAILNAAVPSVVNQ